MTQTELLGVAADIRHVMDLERDNRQLTFVEELHKYCLYDPINEKLVDNMPSVSSLLYNWCDKFDAERMSMIMCNQDEHKAAELRAEWEEKGRVASNVGSYAHYKLEQYVWSLFDIDKQTRKPEYTLSEDDFKEGLMMLENGIVMIGNIIKAGFVPLDTECIMGSIELGYFGQCDNLWLGFFKNQLVFLMTDYKTNLSKNFEVRHFNKPMNVPFGKLYDTELSKYFLQQPLYAQLFKDMLKNTKYKDVPFIGFRVLHLREDGQSHKIPMWVYEEIKKIYPINE